MSSTPPTSRAERRRQTEIRILAAARQAFTDAGYDRTTIRAIAAAADTDPALVMRYFGSKDALFERVAQLIPDEPINGGPAEAVEQLMAALHEKLSAEPTAALALLRSMLTHPEARTEVRTVIAEQQRRTAAAIPADDAMLRAGLINAIGLGVLVGRYLLRLDGLDAARADRICELLRPGFEALVDLASVDLDESAQ